MNRADFAYLAVVAAYMVACFLVPSALTLALGFTLGCVSQWILDWKREIALRAALEGADREAPNAGVAQEGKT